MQADEQNCTIEILNNEKKIKEITSETNQLCSLVQNAIKKIIHREEFTIYHVDIKAISPDGGNYLASLYEINITGETADDKKEINLFVKQAIPGDNFHGYLDIEEAYLREVLFYTELCVIYEKLQNEAGISINNRFRNVKCYSDSGAEAIIMENLTKKGYNALFRMDVMPLKFAQLSVQQLARFHALSFILQTKNPKYFENKLKKLKSVLNANDKFIEIIKKNAEISIECFEEYMRIEFENDLSSLLQTHSKYMSDKISSVNCICHGDFRMNNILAKEESEVTDVVPIDYQLLYYGPPVTDLIYFLFISGDTKFRQHHEADLKDLYRNTMKDFLENFNIDIETVFPRKVFERDYERMRDFGFYVTLALLPLCYIDESNILELGCDLAKERINVDKKLSSRIAGLYEEYIQFKINKIQLND